MKANRPSPIAAPVPPVTVLADESTLVTPARPDPGTTPGPVLLGRTAAGQRVSLLGFTGRATRSGKSPSPAAAELAGPR